MERLSVDYGKKSKLGFSIYPAPQVIEIDGDDQDDDVDHLGLNGNSGTVQRCALHSHHPWALRLRLPRWQPSELLSNTNSGSF